MRTRPVTVVLAAATVLAACGGGGSDASDGSTPQITLVTSTTTAPVVHDSVPTATEPADDGGAAATVDSSVSTTSGAPTVAPTVPPLPTTAVTTEAPDATPAPADGADFVLGADGLGSTSFGASPDGVIAFVGSFLGAPTSDTGWLDAFEVGACSGTQIRQIAWSDLHLEFGDASAVAQGRQHFYAYTYGTPGATAAQPAGLATEEGLTIGSSVADLLAAYPDVQLRSGDEFISDNFFVNDNFTGRLGGLADSDVVEVIIGGLPCET